MKHQTDSINSSVIYPQNYHISNKKNEELGKQINQIQIAETDLNQEASVSCFKNQPQLIHVKPSKISKTCIFIAILIAALLASLGLNIYFGIESTKISRDFAYNKVRKNFFQGCDGNEIQIFISNFQGKKVEINVTHWPDCYYEKQFPKNNQNESKIPNRQLQLISNPYRQSQSDHLIWINEQRISILGWASSS